jgi:hypothetical protein
MTEAENIAAGLEAEHEKQLAHGIKQGDLVRSWTDRTLYRVTNVSGNCLTGYPERGGASTNLHATKVTKLYPVVRDGRTILVTVPEAQ